MLSVALLPTAQQISDATRDVLLGISAYVRPKDQRLSQLSLDSPWVERMREIWGGQLTPPSPTQTRWYLSDLESAERMADNGDLRSAGKLMQAAKKDGRLIGVLSTRTGGLVRLPRKFRGDARVIADLEPRHDEARSLFDEMFPPTELAALAADGLLLGIGVGELVPVRGRDYPVMVRLDPQYLQYIWSENQWYYRSNVGLLPITPGDGRWVLHTPGGRVSPWQNGLWRAVGQAWIRKQHAALHKDNWEGKLANPARVAVAPQGAAEPQKQAVFQQLMAWGINTVFGLTPGYDVKLIESNGRGWESFNETIRQSNEEYVIAVAGQLVTTDGGSGFQNSDIHRTIRADLIKDTADGLAHTVNTQGLPAFVAARFGAAQILSMPVSLEWDVTPPKDRNSEAQSLVTVASAVTQLTDALRLSARAPDVAQLCDQFSVPLLADINMDGKRDTLALPADAGSTAETSAPAVTGEQSAQDSALNGAQIASLLEVVQAVAQGLIPRDAALAIIKRAFLVNEQTADELLGSVGQGFVPSSSTPAPAAPPALPAATPDEVMA